MKPRAKHENVYDARVVDLRRMIDVWTANWGELDKDTVARLEVWEGFGFWDLPVWPDSPFGYPILIDPETGRVCISGWY